MKLKLREIAKWIAVALFVLATLALCLWWDFYWTRKKFKPILDVPNNNIQITEGEKPRERNH